MKIGDCPPRDSSIKKLGPPDEHAYQQATATASSKEHPMFTFPDAFMLMWYACPCEHRELIWNSRDGVVPLAMGCPSCGKPTLRHVQWERDVQAPQHTPYPGQGIWRNGTPDEARAIMGRRLDKCAGTRYEVDAARRAELLEIAASGSEFEFAAGWPMFDRTPF